MHNYGPVCVQDDCDSVRDVKPKKRKEKKKKKKNLRHYKAHCKNRLIVFHTLKKVFHGVRKVCRVVKTVFGFHALSVVEQAVSL